MKEPKEDKPSRGEVISSKRNQFHVGDAGAKSFAGRGKATTTTSGRESRQGNRFGKDGKNKNG